MKKINDKLLNWASVLEDKTRLQAETSSQMPFIFPHIALMPDAHWGRGATVGSVIPTDHAIIPAAVGVDIGCGMCAVRTQFDVLELRLRAGSREGGLAALRGEIERAVPLSAGNYNNKIVETAEPRIEELTALAERAGFSPSDYVKSWQTQLGSLGSGNHFIEITADESGAVWCFLHSGSRGIGNKIASRHIKVAQKLNKQFWIDLPDPELAYLPEGTDEFWSYIREMLWAQSFALFNRDEMMDRVVRQLSEFMGESVSEQERINCHHNYTEKEVHFGKDVWLTRKGAIDASEGAMGLIPGSMATASYVVRGLGNPVALRSSPHGAGRLLGRKAAERELSFELLRSDMAAAGVEWRESPAFLDESPRAYKDIDQIMRDSEELVEVVHELRAVVNVKGES